MSITNIDIDDRHNAGRVAVYPPQGVGAYGHSAQSGALAGAAAASVAWAAQWTSAALVAVIEVLRIRALVITPFTAAQEWGFDAVIARSYSAAHTGGTQYLPSGAGGFKKRTADATSLMAEIRMATTAALGGGTVTPDASPFTSDVAWELVAAATVGRSKVLAEYNMASSQSAPIVLAANEGILVRPTQALGAGGVVRLVVDIAWREIDPAVYIPTTR